MSAKRRKVAPVVSKDADPIDEECIAIRNGTHTGFLAQVKILEDKQREKMRNIKSWKAQALATLEHSYQQKKKQSFSDFLEHRELLREQLLEEASAQRRKERHRGLDRAMTTRKRSAAKDVKVPLTMNGVRSTYTLRSSEIEQDLSQLRGNDKKNASYSAHPHWARHVDFFNPVHPDEPSPYSTTLYRAFRNDEEDEEGNEMAEDAEEEA